MSKSAEGEKVASRTTESGSGVRLFNSFGAIAALQLETRRVHPSNAGISRVEERPSLPFYRLHSAYLPSVSLPFGVRVRFLTLRGCLPSGGFGEGDPSLHSTEQLPAKARREQCERPVRGGGWGAAEGRELEGGSEGIGRPPADGRDSSGGSGAVPSAGWREVASACHATEGSSHE